MINSGTATITLTPTTYTLYSGCTLFMTDHAGNRSNTIALPQFVYGTGIEAFCTHPGLNISQDECVALVALYTHTDGTHWTNTTGRLNNPDVEQRYGVTLTGTTTKHVSLVTLSSNGLTGIVPTEISSLNWLTQLRLDHNTLSNIENGIGSLGSLQVLDLSNTSLTNLPSDIGNLSGSLQQLYLSDNTLSSLPVEIGKLSALSRLYLDSNQLTSLPATISGLTNLDLLDISNNALNSLPVQVGQLTDLNILRSAYNQLATVPNQLGQLGDLDILDLSHNQLTTLPTNVLQTMTGLEDLDMSYNNLTGLSQNLAGLTSLSSLNLEHNQLTGTLLASIGNLAALIDLDVSNNELRSLPNTLSGRSSITFLDASFNHISSLPISLGSVKTMQQLYLDANELTGGWDILIQMTGLKYLYVPNNKLLGGIPDTITQLSLLSGLYLQNNYLDRVNTHNAYIQPSLVARFTRPSFSRQITNQGDVTPPALAGTGSIPVRVPNSFLYTITWSENSYAVTTGGIGMGFVFSGAAPCDTLTTPAVITKTGAASIAIGSTTPGTYSGCSMRLRDHGNNLSTGVSFTTFVISGNLSAFCQHPQLSIPSSECEVLSALYS